MTDHTHPHSDSEGWCYWRCAEGITAETGATSVCRCTAAPASSRVGRALVPPHPPREPPCDRSTWRG